MSAHLGLGSPSFPDVRADSLHDALGHLDGGLRGLIPSPHLLGMVGNLGNLDNLLQEDGGLLEDELEVIFEAVGDFSAAQVGQQQHVDFLDSCLAVPEEGLVLQRPDALCKLFVKCFFTGLLYKGWEVVCARQEGIHLPSRDGV